MTESEREHWGEKAEIENTKRAKANMPAILEALENNDLLALTSYEMSKYSPEQKHLYSYELNVLRLKITKKVLNQIEQGLINPI